jgi:hypothetical protein
MFVSFALRNRLFVALQKSSLFGKNCRNLHPKPHPPARANVFVWGFVGVLWGCSP